jgi:hypothetical protein
MQAECRRPAGYGAAKIDEIAITIGSRADNRICKNDRVGFSPGDLLSKLRPEACLIGRARETRLATQLKVCLHQLLRCFALRSSSAHKRGVQQIHRSNIQRSRNANAAAVFDQTIHKIKTDLAVIQAAVNVCARNIEKLRSAHRFGKIQEHIHCETGGGTVFPGYQLPVEIGELHE